MCEKVNTLVTRDSRCGQISLLGFMVMWCMYVWIAWSAVIMMMMMIMMFDSATDSLPEADDYMDCVSVSPCCANSTSFTQICDNVRGWLWISPSAIDFFYYSFTLNCEPLLHDLSTQLIFCANWYHLQTSSELNPRYIISDMTLNSSSTLRYWNYKQTFVYRLKRNTELSATNKYGDTDSLHGNTMVLY